MADTVNTATTPLSTGVTPAASGGVSPYTNVGSVSSWAQPYVSDMLSSAQQLTDKSYTPYTGQLTAGTSDLQTQAFQGIGGLTMPSSAYTSPIGSWTTQTAQQYMNPYLESSLNPQLDAAKRQAEAQRLADASRMTKAGAYGGSRQAIMESEGARNLGLNLANITGTGYKSAYDTALQQWNTEEQRKANEAQFGAKYGLESLQAGQNLTKDQAALGAQKRAIEQEGLSAAYQQWQNEKKYPYEQLQFQQSMLSGLPLTTSTVSAPQMSTLQKLGAAGSGVLSALQWAQKAGIVDPNKTLSDVLKQGYGWLTGSNSTTPYQVTSDDYTNMLNYLSDQVATGAIDQTDALTAMQAFNAGASGDAQTYYDQYNSYFFPGTDVDGQYYD